MTTTRQFLITLIATIALHAALPSTATAQASGGPDLITPAEARAMKQQSGPAVVFIDVRSRVEAAMRGTAAGIDYVVPYREVAHPMRWDSARSALAMVPNPAFVSQVRAAMKRVTDALIRYRAKKGEYPESLGDLLPDYLDQLPEAWPWF